MPTPARTALITGAGSGIGRALAVEAARRRMSVVLVGRRREPLEETRRRIGPCTDSFAVAADVTHAPDRDRIFAALAGRGGRLDVLVNNAGLVRAGPLESMDDATLERLIATNLVAPMALTRKLLPLLRAAAPSRVVNVGSLLGDVPMPMFAAYAASKSGLRGFSTALRRELKGFGIAVTHAAPRGARTDATAAVAQYVEAQGAALEDAGDIARRIWSAVDAGKSQVYPAGRERLFLLIERLVPLLIDRAVAPAAADDATALPANENCIEP